MVDNYTTIEPQAVGGFKKSFEEQGQTHEKASRTPNSTLLRKCKMRPPATKGNKKRHKLGDKLGNKIGDKTSGRRTRHPAPRRTP